MSLENARGEVARRARASRIVVKIGSGVLTDGSGNLAQKTVRRLATEIAPLIGARAWPYVVSSGAIAVGVGLLELDGRPKTIPGLQAAAAVGQSKLVEAWSAAFRKYDVPVAQVLLTHADLADRRRFLNARHALSELERRRAIAVINENDTVSYEEIAVGDNDGLAAHVSNLVDAGLLILLSVAGGVAKEDGAVVGEAYASDPALDALIRPSKSATGVGGMSTKLKAARMAAARGAYVAIIEGRQPGAIAALCAGEKIGTVLVPENSGDRLRSREHWIAHTLRPTGTVVIDAGAERALVEMKRSLLPKGIVSVEGSFGEGDPVDIAAGEPRRVIARGLAQYGADALRRIAGKRSGAIAEELGFTLGEEAVHRDDLVIFPARSPEGSVLPSNR